MLARPVEERRSNTIHEGDVVVVYERHDRMKAVSVRHGEELQNRFGVFKHSDWIGKPFGSKVSAKSGGFVHLLSPTPELWTSVLSHRTQILYLADISFVVSYLELRPGSLVAESGTGSGSLTTSLARSVAPSGHVYTFDFHEQRASSARQDFARNGLSSLITVEVRDIQGVGFPEAFEGQLDAVFLDLPQPWLAIPSAAKVLRYNGALCSFSPCIEQVQRTCEALQKQKFTEIRTFEVLLRTYEVREESLMLMNQQSSMESKFTSPPHKKQCCESRQDGNDSVNAQDSARASDKLKDMSARLGVPMARPVSESRGHTGYLTFCLSSS